MPRITRRAALAAPLALPFIARPREVVAHLHDRGAGMPTHSQLTLGRFRVFTLLAFTRPVKSGEIRLRGQALGRDFSNKLPFSATELDRAVGTLSLELERQGELGNTAWRWVAG